MDGSRDDTPPAHQKKCAGITRLGRQCQNPPYAPDVSYCHVHGGGHHDQQVKGNTQTPTHAFLELYGMPIKGKTPEEAITEEIERTAGHVQWLGEQIRMSDPESFTKSLWLFRRDDGWISGDDLDMTDFRGAAAIWIDLYIRERNHLVRVSEVALKAGFEERRVKLAETLAERMGLAITNMLGQLGHDVNDPAVRQVAAAALRQAQQDPIEGEVA